MRYLGIFLFVIVILTSGQTFAGLDDAKESGFVKLVPSEQLETQARAQYYRLLNDATAHRALAGEANPLFIRVKSISKRLIPFAVNWNPRALAWRWEVNVIGSNTVNAFCMPGGKIAVYSGLVQQLKLTDDETAMVIGHEMTHALLEHAREQMGKSVVTNGAAWVGGAVIAREFGLNPWITDMVAREGSQLLLLKFSRQNETQADLIGMEIAARAGYDPRAAITLWQKMSALNPNVPNPWFSTHPSNQTRIKDLQNNLSKVMPLYIKAKK
jgi:Zn-dependent protease with chaperone function